MANGIKSINLFSGASSASRNVSKPDPWLQVTRADIVGSASRAKLTTVENTANTNSYIFPTDLSSAHYMTVGISATTRTSIGGGTAKRSVHMLKATDYIRLPLPENIKDINEVSYTEEGAVSYSSFASALMGLGSNQPGATQGQQAAGLAGSISSFVTKSGGTAELKAQAGVVPNQMLTVLLKGPKYKTHSFSWKLYPRSNTESTIIKNIISTLKEKSRPGLDTASAFFTFPHLFDLSFTINTIKEGGQGYFFSFKPAVLESIVANYTPSGQPSLYRETGAPDGVELTLNFKEIEYWLSGDIKSESEILSELSRSLAASIGFGDRN